MHAEPLPVMAEGSRHGCRPFPPFTRATGFMEEKCIGRFALHATCDDCRECGVDRNSPDASLRLRPVDAEHTVSTVRNRQPINLFDPHPTECGDAHSIGKLWAGRTAQ